MENIQRLSFGKMSVEPSQVQREKTSDKCLNKSQKSKTKTYQYLNLENGNMQEISWKKISVSLGESWTHNISEYPRDVKESFLSQILQQVVQEKYYLTKRACQGILQRSEQSTRSVETSSRITEYCLMDQGGKRMDVTLNQTGTLRAQANHPPLIFENHGQDSRYKGPIDITPTLSSSLGTGGNNQPFVVENIANFDVRFTSLNTKNKRHKVYETTTSRTLDTGGNNPNVNQGGVAIVSVYSTSKNSHHTSATKNKTSPLVASDYKDPSIVNDMYRVRRITPLECCRLQGFPDYWCERIEIENPTEEDLVFWRKIFEIQRKLKNGKKQKTDNNVKAWLRNPYSDSAQYKMWGNGVALPCVLYVLSGVKSYLE